MLQWMGGGRRRLKNTRKSIEARQRHFFEQRRQQKRSELSEIPVLNDASSSSQQETVSSLDIASLKNLSRLARTERDNGNGKVNASDKPKKTEVFKGDDVGGDCGHFSGNGASKEAIFDPPVFFSKNKPGIQSQALPIFRGMSVTAEKRDLQEAKIPQNIQDNQTPSNIHPLNMEGNNSQKLQCNIKNGKKKTNLQQKMNPIQRNQKGHKEFAKFDILDIINGHEMEEGKKSSSCEIYATSPMLEGNESDHECILGNDSYIICREERNGKTHSTCESKVSSPRRLRKAPDYFVTLPSARASKSQALDSRLQFESFDLGGNSAFSDWSGFESTSVYHGFFDNIDSDFMQRNVDATRKNSRITSCQIPENIDEIFDHVDCVGPVSQFEESSCDNSQGHSSFQAEYGAPFEQPERDIFNECDQMFRTTYDFEIRNPVSSPLLPERLAGHDKRRKSDGESPQLYPSSDDEIMSLDASPCSHLAFNSIEYLTEKEDCMTERRSEIVSSSGETCLDSSFSHFPRPFNKKCFVNQLSNADISRNHLRDLSFEKFGGTDDESSAVAVIDHLTTWIVTKKPSQCRSPKRICRRMLSNFFKQIEDEHEYESKICMSSVSESLEETRSMEKAAMGGSTVSMSEKRTKNKAHDQLQHQNSDTQQGEKVYSVNSSTRNSQGCLNHLETPKHEMDENMNGPLTAHEEAIFYSSKNPTKVSMPCNESKEIGNTVFAILSRLKKPSQEDVSYY